MRWIALVFALGGCIADQLVPCGDRTCPAGDSCIANECANDAQIAACAGMQPGDACTTDRIPHGFCVGVPGAESCQPSTCGNGVLELGEVCDDGNVVSGDGCSGDCQSNETCGNGYVDGIVGEQCDTGVPFLSGDGCTSRCTAESDSWRDDSPNGFSGRLSPAVAYDARRNRIVLFGGTDLSAVFGDTWEWDGLNWQQMHPAHSPAARSGAAIAFDAAHGRIVLFGGYDLAQVFADTWSYDGITWTQLAPPTSPSGRIGAIMTYDPVHQQVVLFGGALDGQTWLWDGTTWTLAAPAQSPPPRLFAAMAFDTVTNQVVVFGGTDKADSSDALGDTWTWNGATWTPGPTASPRLAATAATNPQTGHVIVCGGRDGIGGVYADCLAWTGATWSFVGNLAVPLAYAGMATDTARGRIAIGAGHDGATLNTSTFESADAATWTLQAPAQIPPANQLFAMTYDVMRGRVVMYGNTTVGDVWEWNGVWHHVVPIGPTPTPRLFPALVYDEAHQVTVMFGGETPPGETPLGDTWQWNGAVWTPLTPVSSPPARTRHGMVYDSARREVILFGGFANGTPLADTWVWTGSTWHQRMPLHSPPTPALAELAFDRARRVALLLDDTFGLWTWDGVDWTAQALAVSPPPTAAYQLAYDATAQRTIVYGGERLLGTTQVAYSDTWSWDGTAWSQRLPVADAGPRSRGAATFDGHRVVMFGGKFALGAPTSTFTYGYSASATPPDRCIAGVDTDGDGRAGCDDPDCWSRCTPMCAPGEPCDPTLPHCGDGTCAPIEDYMICPADCSPP